MSEATKRLRANKLIEGKPCGWCARSIEFGQDVAICNACETPQHAECWDNKGGCISPDCIHAPLKQLKPTEPTKAPLGMCFCPHCGNLVSQTDEFCVHCSKAPTADGTYQGPKQLAPGAVASMVWGIVGIFLCGLIVGLVAISKSNAAKQAIAADPRLKGSGYATAGLVLGIIDVVFGVILLVVMATGRGG